MTLIRRLVIVLVGISLAVLVTVLLVNPDTIMRLARSLGDTSIFIRLPLAILIDAVVVAVIVILVRGEPQPRTAAGLIVKAQGAITDISVDSARDRILRSVRAVPDVLAVEAEVKAVHGRADVDLDVVVSRESANLPEKQREIDRALRTVVNKQLGLQMAGKPRVHIRMDDERTLIPVELPGPVSAPAPVPVAEPVKPEVADETPAKAGEPLNVETVDTMTVRADPESLPDSPDPTT